MWSISNFKARYKTLKAIGKIYGYENIDLANHVVNRTLEYKEKLNNSEYDLESFRIASVIGLSKTKNGEVRVLDVGGGAGIHFYAAQRLFPELEFKWVVLETKSMIEVIRNQESAPNLVFVSDLNDAFTIYGDFTIAIANSSLQYFENPLTLLKTIIDSKPFNFYIGKTPMSDNDEFKFLQTSWLDSNGPGRLPKSSKILVNCEVSIFKKNDYRQILNEHYSEVIEIEEGIHTFGTNNRILKNYGFFAKNVR